MDITTSTLIALGVVGLLVLAFFSVFRYRGKFAIKTKLGEITAEGENAPPVAVHGEMPAPVPDHPTQKIRAGSTEIGQVGTGANVFVAQPGGNIIVQTTDRARPPAAQEPQQNTTVGTDPVVVPVSEKNKSQVTIRVKVEDAFYNECDTPPPTTTWVGRSEELLLMDHAGIKVIAVTGMGGQGKSTLAAKFLSSDKNAPRFFDWRDCKEESNTLHTQIVRIIERITKRETRASDLSGETTGSVIKLFLNIAASIDGVFVFDNVDQYIDVVNARAVDSMHLLIEGALRSRGVAPRFDKASSAAARLSGKEINFLQLQEWEIDRAYLDWLKSAAASSHVK